MNLFKLFLFFFFNLFTQNKFEKSQKVSGSSKILINNTYYLIRNIIEELVRIRIESNRITVNSIRFLFGSKKFETDKFEISNYQWFVCESLASCCLFSVSLVINLVLAHINLRACACAYSSRQLSLDSIRYFHLSDMTAQSMAVFQPYILKT